MSGIDEKKPTCPFCVSQEHVDVSHNLLFHKIDNNWVGRTTSKNEDEKYGTKIIIGNMNLDKDIITLVRCSHCNVTLDPHLTLKAKKYFWRLQEKGDVLTGEEWRSLIRSLSPPCLECNDGVVNDCRCTNYCGECGNLHDDCRCHDDDEQDEDGYYDEEEEF